MVTTPAPPPPAHDVDPSGAPATSVPNCFLKLSTDAYTSMRLTMLLSTMGSRNCEIGQCYEIPPQSNQYDTTIMPPECCFGIDGESLSPDYCSNVNRCTDNLIYFVIKYILILQHSPQPSHCPSLSPSSSPSVVLSDILTIALHESFSSNSTLELSAWPRLLSSNIPSYLPISRPSLGIYTEVKSE